MKSLIFCLFLLGSTIALSQVETSVHPESYIVTLHPLSYKEYSTAQSVLERLSSANSIQFRSNDSTFLITTFKNLDYNVLKGKMQKNFYPIKTIFKTGEPITPFPKLQKTENTIKDEELYEIEKNKWVKENPEAYKQMIMGNTK